jgi:predicted lipid-binding transport protein (Tim44 family)
MRKLAALAAVLLTFAIGAADVEAKRLGGARSSGVQRQSTEPATPPAQSGTPGSPSTAGAPAQAAAAAPATAAATAKRSWAGPLTGLAAGLGLAALASYLGFGEALANLMLIALVAMALLAIIGFVLRRRAAGGGLPVTAGGASIAGRSVVGSRIGAALGGISTTRPTGVAAIPTGFDAGAFALSAKAQFVALQSANDAADLQRLRDYLTPRMFEVVRDEVQARGGAAQHTEVFGLDAKVVEVAEEHGQHVVSVRFTGRVREQAGSVPEDLDEIWHLTKPRTGPHGWVVAGIQLVTQPN